MSQGSQAGDTGDRSRDLVFVSYSRSDAEWVQRFKVLLSPLLRSKRLRLWIDTDIRTGDAWHPDILAAVRRSTTALILVSADFLASDFIMDEELPALIKHGARLAPVLVGSCMWDQVGGRSCRPLTTWAAESATVPGLLTDAVATGTSTVPDIVDHVGGTARWWQPVS